MKGKMKKVVSLLLSIAMIFTSVNITPSTTVGAVEGWKSISGLKYQSSNTEMIIQYKVAKGEETQAIVSYDPYYVHIYPKNFVATDAKIYLDEGMTTEGTTKYTGWSEPLTGMVNMGLGLSTANLKENKYYSLRFVYGTSDVVYYFYTGNAGDITEPTTEAPTEAPTETPTEAPTKEEANVDVPANLVYDESATEAYKVTWHSVTGAASYNVYFDNTLIGNTKDASYKIDIAKMMDGEKHEVTVSAIGEDGTETEKSAPLEAKINLNWQTNETLTAQCGEGAKFAKVGVNPEGFNFGEFSPNVSYQLFSAFGATQHSASVIVNGKTIASSTGGNSAMSCSYKYADLLPGYNTYACAYKAAADSKTAYEVMYIYVPYRPQQFDVYDYANKTGKYIFKFEEIADATSYKVYIDGNDSGLSIAGSGDYLTVSKLKEVTTVGEHDITITAVLKDGSETIKSASKAVKVIEKSGTANDIAQIYVHTDDKSIAAKTGLTKNKVTCAITAVNKAGENYTEFHNDAAKTTIKVRGNSTAGADKKAFNISFSKAVDLYGMGEAKKWSLLANAFDKSLIRNKIAMDFGTETMGIQYNSKSKFIDLYINGTFMGSYLAIESVETGSSRVDIDAESVEGDTLSDILLELDSNGRDIKSDGHLFNPSNEKHPTSDEITADGTGEAAWADRTTKYDMEFAVNEPEMDPTKPADYNKSKTKYTGKMQAVYNYLEEFETALSTDNWEKISRMIDVNSFVDFYLVSEFFKNQDIAFSSTRFYIKNGILYAGPMWDYDLSSGNVSVGYYGEEQQSAKGYKATELKWFEALMKDSTFKNLVRTRYNELLPRFKELTASNGTIDKLVEEISGSITRNYTSVENGGAGWSIATKDSGDGYSNINTVQHNTHAEYVDDFKAWINERIEFLSKEWGYDVNLSKNSDNHVKVTWNAIGGATGYKITYTPKTTAENTSLERIVSASIPIATFGLTANVASGDDNTETVYVNNNVTEYDFTANNIDINEDKSVYVYYTTSEGYTAENGSQYEDTFIELGSDKIASDETVDISDAQANTPSTDNLDGWIETNSHGGTSADSSKDIKYYIAKNYFSGGEKNEGFFAADGVWGFFPNAKTMGYGGGDANTITGEAFAFASNSITTDFDSIWIDGVKITDTALYCQSPTNPDVMTISKALLDLGNADSKVFYITVKRKTAGDHTFPILVQKYDPYQITVPELDDPNWTPFKDSATQSNIAVNGDQYYIQTTFKNSVTNKANFGLYDKTSSLEQPAWGIPFKDGNANTPLVSFIIGNSASVSAVSVDGVRYPADGIKVANGGDIAYMAQSLFDLNGEENHIFKVIVYCQNSSQDVAFAMKVVKKEQETTTEKTTEQTTEPTIPDGATWVSITGTAGEYQYYIPAEYANYSAVVNNESKDLYFGYKIIGAPFKEVKLNGVSYTNSEAAYVRIKKSDIADYKNYKLEVTSADGNTTVPIYVRRVARDYTPTGLTGTVSKSGLVNISWTASQDAVNDGYTYKVTVGGKDATVAGTTATYQLGNEGYGTYEIVVSTIDGAGNVLASAKTNIEYRAPISFTDDAGQWERCRYEEIKWTAVDGAVKYAVYVDGKLYQTIDDPTQEKTTVPAYAFANGTNASNQPTTVGKHTSAIVAIKDANATVMKNLDDVNKEDIMGQNEFSLYVNYIYGKETHLWNTSGTDSKWNFTVSEAVNGGITEGADVKVNYNSNGYADLTFNNMGKHSGTDQAWTIKAAIYDEAAKNGETQNLGFNIYGPKELIGQTIRIKCCSEEVRDGNYTGAGDIYEEKDYTFEADENGNAIIKYSMSFESRNDSYDLLFGLGNLNFKDATDKTLTLSDADISTVYGITDLKATGTNTETETGDLFVSWSTNIPNRMLGSYTYQVTIDGEVYNDPTYGTEIPGTVQNITAKDYAVGEHTVVVKSIYHSTITSSKEDKATISQTKKPDLVITDISVPEGTHYIGETVTVSVTMKNIGNADAVPPAGNNLCMYLYGTQTDGSEYRITWSICNLHQGEEIDGVATNGYLKPGEEYTGTFTYEIKQLDNGTNFYNFRAIADADKVVDEGTDEDNNEFTKRFKFYDPVKEVTFTKDNGSIVATWPASNDIKEYIVKYVVNGETKTKTVTENKCDFGDLVAFDEGSTVSVTTVGSDDDEHVHATGKPLSDLIISDVSIPKTIYVEGEVIPITLTMKNVGFTAGTASGNLTIKPIKGEEFLITGIEGDAWRVVDSPIAVNDERTVTYNYTVQKEDAEAGTINIGGMADADNYPNGGVITECDETNNKKEVTINILSAGTITLDSNNGDGPVKATWSEAKGAESYRLHYVVDGQTMTKDVTDTSYTFGDDEGLDNKSDVEVLVKYSGDDTYYNYATTKAMADLVVSNVSKPVSSNGDEGIRLGYTFSMDVTIKNIGTAQVRKKPADASFGTGYANYTIAAAITYKAASTIGGEDVKNMWSVNDAYTDGIKVGQTVTRTVDGMKASEATDSLEFTCWADHYGNSENENVVEFIDESNENNNTKVVKYAVSGDKQRTTMDWTRLRTEDMSDTPYLFPVASGSQKAYIDYKVISTNSQYLDYKDIVNRYVGYAGANMTIQFNNDAGTFVNYTEVKDGKQYTNTTLEFAQIPNYDESNDLGNFANGKVKWIDFATKSAVIVDNDGNVLHDTDPNGSSVAYNGNGMNMYVGNFGLYKYYATRFTTPGGDTITIAYRVTDDKPHTGTWTQSLASDNVSNPNTLPMYYCGTNPQKTNDTCNVENYDGQSYETTGALWYSSEDIKLSSISVYNGNWLSVATSEYTRFAKDSADGTKNWKVQIARAQVDTTNNNKFVGKDGQWYDVDPNTAGSHVGIQGTNTIHIGLPWLLENLPIHSDKGGQKDTEFYWIRIVPDTAKGTSDSDNPSMDDINVYEDGSILIPVTLYADIPQIQPAQDVNAQMSYDDDDNSVFTVTWSELPEQVTYGYTYKIFIGNEEIGGPYTQQQTLTFDYGTYKDKLEAANNKVTVKAYWCEQEISTDVEVKAETNVGWNLISGQSEINILAGQSQPVETPGIISFYYDRADNHVNSVIGYNGDYIAINGNTKYYNANSKVSVTSGFTTRVQVEAARKAIKDGTADSYTYSDVEKYEYIDGQLQIMAKNLMTANHLTTCYLVKIETTNDDGTSYTSYVMMESVVETKGDVAIRGFQMNTDATPGAVSEYAPSFRVVSRASKIAAVKEDGDTDENPSIEAIVARGTIYALADNATNDDMKVTYTPNNDDTQLGDITTDEEKGIHQFMATSEKGIVVDWSGAANDTDKDQYDYYAVTFKPVEYITNGLTQNYKVRAYAISENGQVIYDTTTEDGYNKPVVPTVSVYSMAEYLYNNCKMPNEAAHDYLYDNVLNIVSITNNYINITKQMLKALGITSKNDENYKYVNAMYRDLYYYAHLAKNYAYKSYMDRGKFTSKTQFDNVDNETILLKILNDKLNPDTPYTSVADWITRNVTENGFYQVKKYESATANTGEQV